jgi:hypothetical protein
VAGIRYERALPFECLLETLEHVVQCLPEAPDLVVGGRDREALAVLLRRNRLRPPTHPFDRSQRGGDGAVAGQAGEQERRRPAEQQEVPEVVQRVVAILEGGAHDHHERPVLSMNRRRQQACRSVVHPGDGLPFDEVRVPVRGCQLGW